jgi:Aldo/keto reductase family
VIENMRFSGMAVTAYCGMAIGRVFTDATLAGIAARHDKGIAQVVLRWLLQQDGVVALSRTTNPQRVAENLAIFDFELESEEMNAIHGLAKPNSQSSIRPASPRNGTRKGGSTTSLRTLRKGPTHHPDPWVSIGLLRISRNHAATGETIHGHRLRLFWRAR